MRGTTINRAYCCAFCCSPYTPPLSNPIVTGGAATTSAGALPAVTPAPAPSTTGGGLSALATTPAATTPAATDTTAAQTDLQKLGFSDLTSDQAANIASQYAANGGAGSMANIGAPIVPIYGHSAASLAGNPLGFGTPTVLTGYQTPGQDVQYDANGNVTSAITGGYVYTFDDSGAVTSQTKVEDNTLGNFLKNGSSVIVPAVTAIVAPYLLPEITAVLPAGTSVETINAVNNLAASTLANTITGTVSPSSLIAGGLNVASAATGATSTVADALTNAGLDPSTAAKVAAAAVKTGTSVIASGGQAPSGMGLASTALSTLASLNSQYANTNNNPTETSTGNMAGFYTAPDKNTGVGTGSTNQSPIDAALPVTGLAGGVDGTQFLNTTNGALPTSTTVASNDPLAGTGLTTDANGNLVFSNPGLTAAGPAGPMTAGLTNVPGSAPPMTDAELAAAAKTGQTIDLGAIGNLDNTDSQSTSGTDTSTNDNTDTSGDTGGLSLSIPTSSGSSGLSASEVQNIVAQQMAANPGLSEAQVKADIQSAMAANPGMTADQVNQIVQNNLSSLTGQVSGLQSGQAENKSALDALNNTVNTNQATTNSALASTNEAVANLSASDKAAFSQLTTDQQAQALKEAQDTGNLSSAISNVAAGTAANTSAIDALNNTVNTNQAQTTGALSNLSGTVAANQAQTENQLSGMSAQEKSDVAALQQQGVSLQDAINQASQQSSQQLQSGLASLSSQFQSQLENSDAQTQQQFGQLSQEQQQQAQALAAQGTSLTDAINSVQAGLTSTIGDLSSTFDQKLAASDQATQDAFNGLSDAQKAQATQEAQDTGNLQQAIDNASATSQSNLEAATSGLTNTINTNQQATNEALASTNQNVANLSDQEKTDFGQLSGQQQSDFQNLSSDQADLAKSLTDMGTSFGDAIDQVKNLDEQGIATVQGQLDAYQQQTQAGLDTTNQNINDLSTQTQDEIAKAAEAAAAANAATNSTIASDQASTSSALQGLGAGLTGLQQAQQQAKAQAMMPKFNNDTSVLQTTDPHEKMAKLAALHELYSTLDPSLKELLAPQENKIPVDNSDNQEQQAAHGGLIHMAGAGSVSDAVDDLVSANTPTMQSVFNDAQKALQPTPMRAPASTGLVSDAKYVQAAKQRQLQHLYNSISPALRGYLVGGPVVGMGGMAEGGLPARYHPEAPEGHHPEFITGQTGYYAAGRGTGQSDDIPAMLHDGDYVIDADSVAQLGDGSSKAGAQALEHFRNQIPHHAHGGPASPVPAKIADGEYVLPAAFVSALGSGDNKTGSKLLDKMREELREHKRSAPVNKIPPKAKSPLDYLRMAKG